MTQEKFPAPAYTESVLRDIFEDAKRLFVEPLLEVDLAHAIMLAEQGIITRTEARALLIAVRDIDRERIQRAQFDGSCEDLFFFIETLVTEACGDNIAGRLHTARSRNDIDVTIYRMRLRHDALSLLRATMNLRGVLLKLAAQNHETVIPAYTHTQPAQPTTLAHYLLAMAETLGRDVVRQQRALDNMNFCPLGSCAITTTGFPINRERTAQLLGFTAPTVNSYASIAGVDYFTEAVGVMTTLLINTGKFSQEFLLWAMREFDAIRLSDGYVQCSSIMPQKRNPVALEHVRTLASKALGQAQGVITAIHNTPFGDINDVEDDLQPLIVNAFRDARRAVSLLAASLSTATFNTELLSQRAGNDFIAVTELADTIVRQDGLPFRTAHQIVAQSVREALAQKGEITFDILQNAAQQIIGRDITMDADGLRQAMNPVNFVNVRNILGGPAPDETRRAWQVESDRALNDEEWYKNWEEKLLWYARNLQETTQALIAG